MTFRKLRVHILRVAAVPYLLAPLLCGPRWHEGEWAEYACEWLGYGLLMAGLGLRMWSVFYIGESKSKDLATAGPYSITRNPLYLGTFAITIGVALAFQNPIMLATALLVVVPLHVVAAIKEESHLEAIFGSAYREYRARVPRFGVSLRSYHHLEAIAVSTFALHRAVRDMIFALLIPPAVDGVQILHQLGWLPLRLAMFRG